MESSHIRKAAPVGECGEGRSSVGWGSVSRLPALLSAQRVLLMAG